MRFFILAFFMLNCGCASSPTSNLSYSQTGLPNHKSIPSAKRTIASLDGMVTTEANDKTLEVSQMTSVISPDSVQPIVSQSEIAAKWTHVTTSCFPKNNYSIKNPDSMSPTSHRGALLTLDFYNDRFSNDYRHAPSTCQTSTTGAYNIADSTTGQVNFNINSHLRSSVCSSISLTEEPAHWLTYPNTRFFTYNQRYLVIVFNDNRCDGGEKVGIWRKKEEPPIAKYSK